jgi:UDP-N-acetylmuramate dehydrogenase
MIVYKNIPLKKHNTFGLEYIAECMIIIKSEKEAISLFRGGTSLKKPLLILGGGSNILFTSNFKGTIIYPDLGGVKVEEHTGESVLISAGAGISWDKLVKWTVNKGFGGLENLSLIPGSVGAAPVQNIGAYGTEVKDHIEKVRTISTSDGSIRVFNNEECKFGYRDSFFKRNEKGRYMVTRVFFRLNSNPVFNINYGSLKEEIDKIGCTNLKNIRQAVINIRRCKLPDPEITGNAGSFFKNPLVNKSVAGELKKRYETIPAYPDPSGNLKLPAGWLIEHCGWKGKRIGDAAVHDKQALVLVNLGKATGEEIFNLSEKIRQSVFEKFGIEIEREVEIIGTI